MAAGDRCPSARSRLQARQPVASARPVVPPQPSRCPWRRTTVGCRWPGRVPVAPLAGQRTVRRAQGRVERTAPPRSASSQASLGGPKRGRGIRVPGRRSGRRWGAWASGLQRRPSSRGPSSRGPNPRSRRPMGSQPLWRPSGRGRGPATGLGRRSPRCYRNRERLKRAEPRMMTATATRNDPNQPRPSAYRQPRQTAHRQNLPRRQRRRTPGQNDPARRRLRPLPGNAG
jgi:hypothetical protein